MRPTGERYLCSATSALLSANTRGLARLPAVTLASHGTPVLTGNLSVAFSSLDWHPIGTAESFTVTLGGVLTMTHTQAARVLPSPVFAELLACANACAAAMRADLRRAYGFLSSVRAHY